MRGEKWKRVLSWLLCVCLMTGLIPVSAFAADTGQQSESTLASQEDETSVKETEQQPEQTAQQDSEEQSQSEQTEQQDQSDQSGAEAEQSEKTSEQSEAATQKDDKKQKKVAPQAADGAAVTAVKLTETEAGSVWGKGLITGSGDMDDKSWDRASNENRGYDSATDNDIIRSFDSITYNVSATLSSLTKGNTYTLVFEVTLPDDDELTLDDDKMNAIKPIECRKNEDGTKTYICKYAVEKNYAGGEKEQNIIVKVGNKKQDDVIRPMIKAYLNENQSAALEVQNMQDVKVTSAPMYNIVLKKNTNLAIEKDVFDFSEKNSEGKTHYKENAEGYKDYKVTGYRCIYGFALELRKPGDGIKGVELPDAAQDFTFDIDLSEATLNGKSLVDNGFAPLLFYLGPNEAGGGAVWEIPFSKYLKDSNGNQTGCLDSGNVSMTQEGTTLHVTVKDFKIDSSQFPKKNAAGTSYWEDLNKIREGIFSAYQFQVVYPYINKDGKVLSEELGDGTINVAASVSNMKAVSTTGTKATTETSTDDNKQTNSWNMTSGHKRNQEIFWSGRYEKLNKLDGYSPNQRRNDGDIAAVGANDVGFTVAYSDTDVGEASFRKELPVAIDQFVLFDRNAVENVEFATNAVSSDKGGYNCSVRYAVLKNGGHLDNEAMRTATMDDFDFYDTKPEGGCDAVLVQYRGTNLGASTLSLYAQFNADVKQDAEVADKVYMVTAFTKVWTAEEFSDEILAATGKTSLEDVSRKEISDWGKAQNAMKLVENKDLVQPLIDNRNVYTVPTYVNGVYTIDKNHKFDVASADALYIVPYTTTVTKTVAQLDNEGNPQQRYNVGKNQRYVDYKISSSMKFWADVEPVEGSKTTVYLEDTIPKGLTYIQDSAYWGGTYTSKYPQAGEVTGGQQINPVITNNQDGTTTLKWKIKDVAQVKGELPTLYYSCKISNDVADNETLKNTVKIKTDEDQRSPYKDNDNISTAAMTKKTYASLIPCHMTEMERVSR